MGYFSLNSLLLKKTETQSEENPACPKPAFVHLLFPLIVEDIIWKKIIPKVLNLFYPIRVICGAEENEEADTFCDVFYMVICIRLR